MQNIYTNLNKEQLAAVCENAQHLLILAGAGSGKTRVLVHRIAYLLQEKQIPSYAILAVTFTNKAALEMKTRIEALVGAAAKQIWIGTFHSLSHKFLRKHYQELDLDKNFQIMDAQDQQRLIKRVIKNLNLDEERWQAKEAQWFINKEKDRNAKPGEQINKDLINKTLADIYKAYQVQCKQASLIDFADLLMLTCEFLQKNNELRAHYQNRFQHILVDEFQDTNTIQYDWLKLLLHPRHALTVVGDDDQSIYGWRGAQIENIQKFKVDFNDTRTIRLEQNYRSSGNILKAANALINNNHDRLGKNLWTEDEIGEKINLFAAYNDIEEARFIADTIKSLKKEKIQKKDCAILYRSNAQSRVLEETLMQMNIDYKVYGGLRFFERAEIKDSLSYLQLIVNNDNNAAFIRIINLPTRGIGDKTLEFIHERAQSNNISLWGACNIILSEDVLGARASSALENFINLIVTLKKEITNLTLTKQLEIVVHGSGILQHYKNDKSEKGINKVENLEELINAAAEFQFDTADEFISPLQAFLSYTTLDAGDENESSAKDYVQLMTLHSAKGLEFPVVFLSGMEEGLFPHQMSIAEPGRLEEERRLCYVGITRAMKKLYITHAKARRLHGYETLQRPSRFIKEIPNDCLEDLSFDFDAVKIIDNYKPKKSLLRENKNSLINFGLSSAKISSTTVHGSGFKLGQSVTHQVFGPGTILNFDGSGDNARVEINFAKAGRKWLLLRVANLK